MNRLVVFGVGGLLSLSLGVASAIGVAKESEPDAQPSEGQGAASEDGLSPPARALLRELFAAVGVAGSPVRRVERTVERQTRVMYELAKADVERARQMYCPAGDAVIDRFDPTLGLAPNLERMKAELILQLPRARALGCLNHVENDQVFSVDVPVSAIAEGKREAFVEAARGAVRAGRAERFLAPPVHPDAYHFEFRRE